ncbi:hypothetical protein UFOVP842_36 [uncultured Caudovirales phage]|uniref:Uncharacterized protein n=1 Tax=uncultured Caudovirales phage TaxID=2100421 RepID=A0A6J5LSP2_9CAUD|nr:hypothetical protein UFOVP305_19 [uncultured Caudovirales phage]CAB4151641.1 hypothetical protein UFOVP593_26 [uncultured Caudovirales phage]CAB4166572.1 hypothetical protein UFOVP842_36 [uncultured Caudovirales phage]
MTILDPARIPVCDTSDPASLEAWYGTFGWADHLRKIVLSNCAEMIRAAAAVAEEKLSETRINDLAHTHHLYLDFILESLQGRTLREQNVRDSIERGNTLTDMRR